MGMFGFAAKKFFFCSRNVFYKLLIKINYFCCEKPIVSGASSSTASEFLAMAEFHWTEFLTSVQVKVVFVAPVELPSTSG